MIICRNDKDKMVRTLRNDQVSGGGCRAVYTKQGVDQVVGSSQRGQGCNAILDSIRETLEKNIWKCKESKESNLSDL